MDSTVIRQDQAEPGPSPTESALAIHLAEVLTKFNRDVRRRTSGEAPPFAQLSILRSLLCEGDATVSALARREHTDQPSVSRSVHHLTNEGLVARVFHPTDLRLTILRLTPRGRAIVVADIEQRHDLLSERISSLTEGQRSILAEGVTLLNSLADHNI